MSPSEFIIPYDEYMESVKKQLFYWDEIQDEV
jgi:uncharacterized protein (DUF927 family)